MLQMREQEIWNWATWATAWLEHTCAHPATQLDPRPATSSWTSSLVGHNVILHICSQNVNEKQQKSKHLWLQSEKWAFDDTCSLIPAFSQQCRGDCGRHSGFGVWLHLPPHPLLVVCAQKEERQRRWLGQWHQVSEVYTFWIKWCSNTAVHHKGCNEVVNSRSLM